MVKHTLRVPHPLHLRHNRRDSGFSSHPACRRPEDQNAALPQQVQGVVVRRCVRPRQIRPARLLQGHGAEDAETYVDGRHGVDRLRADLQGYRVKVVQYAGV